jgi:hypothetical protein
MEMMKNAECDGNGESGLYDLYNEFPCGPTDALGCWLLAF